ncbi:MAG: PH domain-containing protein [Planctomycetota bacterium]
MIQLECDNCEMLFDVEDRDAGGKVPCPHCGDINRVPEAAAAPEPRAEEEAPVKGDRETPIRTVRPSMFRAHPVRGLVVALLILGGLVMALASGLSETVAGWILWPGLLALAVGLVWLLFWWVRTTLWIRVEISNKRTVRYEGIIRRHSTEVLHDHVRSVDIQQNFVQRLFNVGYIGIDSAGQDQIEIEIRDIPGPYQVKEIIDRYRTM